MTIMNTTTQPRTPGGYTFEDGFDADFGTTPTTPEDIRKGAHIVNGGEAQFTCPACHGTGQFKAYTGRYVGPCFKCKGKGNITKGQNAAIKGKATKAANIAQWAADHADEITYMRKRADKGNHFYAGMLEKLAEWGKLTENQLALVTRDIAKDAEFFAKREAAAPVIPTAAIQALFDKATEKLTKTAIFRTTEITINKAPGTGQNPGALYVKTTGDKTYCGKIVDGKFIKKWGAPDVTEALQKVAADPTAEAIAYARKFKACCCCGKTLRDPVSVLAVVGPVCGPRWGLDHLRMAAAEMLAEEKAAEEGGAA